MQKIQCWVMVALFMTTASCATLRELPGAEMACPDAPKCVSSQATDARHFVEPFSFDDQPDEAMLRLKQALLAESRVTIVEERDTYLRVEVRSLLFRFVDDVEFTLEPEKGLIQLRSSARVGYTDFGVNRKRIERIRKVFQQ